MTSLRPPMPKPPTAKQLAQAADIATRFAATRDLSDEERTHLMSAAHMMGMAALARAHVKVAS